MASNHRFTFPGEGDHDPGKEPGDVVIQLVEKEHETFQRHGRDLSMRLDVALSEALGGFAHPLKTLDGRTVLLQVKPGEAVIKHGAMKTVAEEGFPTHRDPFNKGRLIVVFNVVFPESLSADTAKKLAKLLPKPDPARPVAPADADPVRLEDFDGQGQWKGGIEEQENGEDEEDVEMNGGHDENGHGGPQCAQQ